jgi:hypothetical protein
MFLTNYLDDDANISLLYQEEIYKQLLEKNLFSNFSHNNSFIIDILNNINI